MDTALSTDRGPDVIDDENTGREATDLLLELGRKRSRRLKAVKDVTAELRAAVAAAADAGLSEVEIARCAGVTRVTVRDWLGKGASSS